MDKLEGLIDAEFWKRQSDILGEKLRGVREAKEKHQRASESYMLKGVELLELAERSSELFVKQTPREKRRLLKTVLSNPRVKDGKVLYNWKSPFDLMAKRAFSKEWGGRWDSNPRQTEPQSAALPTELRPPQFRAFLYKVFGRVRQRKFRYYVVAICVSLAKFLASMAEWL